MLLQWQRGVGSISSWMGFQEPPALTLHDPTAYRSWCGCSPTPARADWTVPYRTRHTVPLALPGLPAARPWLAGGHDVPRLLPAPRTTITLLLAYCANFPKSQAMASSQFFRLLWGTAPSIS